MGVACRRAKGRHVQLPWLVYRCVEHCQMTCRCGLFVKSQPLPLRDMGGSESDARLRTMVATIFVKSVVSLCLAGRKVG